MKNTMGKRRGLLPVLFGMFVITVCIIGCSGKKTETVAPKENAEIIIEHRPVGEQAETKNELPVTQQAVEAEIMPPEQIVTAPVEAEPAEKPIAPAASPAAPQQPAAPRYVIGDTGPGKGMVFSVNNGTYKEVALQTFINFRGLDDLDMRGGKGEYDRNSDYYYRLNNVYWMKASIYDLAAIYKSLVKTGKINFSGWMVSGTLNTSPKPVVYNTQDFEPQFPGYYIILTGEAGSPWCMNFDTGKITDEDFEGDFAILLVRQFK